jgi:CysZ protein
MLGDLARGARAVLGGVAFVVRTPRTWILSLAPAMLGLLLAAGLSALGVWGVMHLARDVMGSSGELATIGRFFFDLLFGALVVFVAVVVAFAVAQPLARAALEKLARSLEEEVGGGAGTMPSSSIVQSIGTAVTALGFSVPTIGALEGVTLVVPEAGFVTEPLAFVAAGLALAWDLLDHPFSRRGLGPRARLRWMRQNAALVLGFALTAQALLLVPGLDLFFLPVGIVGATRLLAEAERRRGAP